MTPSRLLKILDRQIGAALLVAVPLLSVASYACARVNEDTLILEESRDRRLTIYSGIAGVNAGLLGFLVAALAILVALPGLGTPIYEHARRQVVQVMLCTSTIMGFGLFMAMWGILFNTGSPPAPLIQSLMIASLAAASIGLALTLFGIWAMLKRTRPSPGTAAP